MRTGHKLEKRKTEKRTLYIRLTTRYADNNIGDGEVAYSWGLLETEGVRLGTPIIGAKLAFHTNHYNITTIIPKNKNASNNASLGNPKS